MAKLDLNTAFETLPLPVAEVTLQRAGVERLVVDAFLTELLSLHIDLNYQGHETGPIPISKGLLQADPFSAPVFSASAGRILIPLHRKWAQGTDPAKGVDYQD
eukprot:11937322-Heterocapsa_arctica.AAC.1